MKKLLFSLILTTLISTGLNASTQTPNHDQSVPPTIWRIVTENSLVSIKSGYMIHNTTNVNHRYISLRVTNKTNQEVTMTFTKKLWYDNYVVIPDDHETTLTIPANSHVEGDVDDDINGSLLIFFENLGVIAMGKLTKYEINIIN